VGRHFSCFRQKHSRLLHCKSRLLPEFALLAETSAPLETVLFEQKLKNIVTQLQQANFVHANAHLGVAHSLETDDLLPLAQQPSKSQSDAPTSPLCSLKQVMLSCL
jgi:hypothetical protein